MNKNLRVAHSCGSCARFGSLSGYSGKKKNGYCFPIQVKELPPQVLDPKGSWDDFVHLYTAGDFEANYVYENKHKYSWAREYDKLDLLRRDYQRIMGAVNWWKDNGHLTHTTHRDCVCDEYVCGGRTNSHASKHTKKNNIGWLDKLNEES